MQSDWLRHFDPFSALSPAHLQEVAKRVRRVSVPAGRWLVRPGRRLSDHVFLGEGRVRLHRDQRTVLVAAGSERARAPVYPGASGVQTLTPAVFVTAAPGLLAGLAGTPGPGAGLPVASLEVVDEATVWQHRFLASPLLQRFDPRSWQRVLQAMSGRACAAGEVVVALGDPADCCNVLAAGTAEIVDADGARLAVLSPGCLFGEDALISGGARNASVRMGSTGRVMSLPAAVFRRWLLEPVTVPLERMSGETLISLEPGRAGSHWLPIRQIRARAGELDPKVSYAVAGGTDTERALAAFLLAEHGILARPLAGAVG